MHKKDERQTKRQKCRIDEPTVHSEALRAEKHFICFPFSASFSRFPFAVVCAPHFRFALLRSFGGRLRVCRQLSSVCLLLLIHLESFNSLSSYLCKCALPCIGRPAPPRVRLAARGVYLAEALTFTREGIIFIRRTKRIERSNGTRGEVASERRFICTSGARIAFECQCITTGERRRLRVLELLFGPLARARNRRK